MAWKPTFKLYASDGVTLVYQFENVTETNWPQDNPFSIELNNTRSQGGIVIPGGDKPWDLTLSGILIADNYTDLTAKIFALRDTILTNTKYVLHLDKTDSTYDTINVMRLINISMQPSQRTKIQRFTLTFRANSWA